MPPTFLIFLGLIIYLGLISVTVIVFVPMFFLDSKKLMAKKVLTTALVSFPCLITMGLFCAIIFVIPTLVFSWFVNSGYIPQTLGTVLTIIGVLIFVGSVAISSLYLWYFISKIIYQRIDKKPITEFLVKDKVFKFLQPYLVKLKLYHPVS